MGEHPAAGGPLALQGNITKYGGVSGVPSRGAAGGGGDNNGQRKCKYKIVILEKKVRNQKRQLLVFNTADKPGSDEEELDDSDK